MVDDVQSPETENPPVIDEVPATEGTGITALLSGMDMKELRDAAAVWGIVIPHDVRSKRDVAAYLKEQFSLTMAPEVEKTITVTEEAPKPKPKKKKARKRAKKKKLPHVSKVQGSKWIDDAGNILELDQTMGRPTGEYTLRIIKYARR